MSDRSGDGKLNIVHINGSLISMNAELFGIRNKIREIA